MRSMLASAPAPPPSDYLTFLYSVPLPNILFDLATLLFVVALLLLSLFACSSVFYLQDRSLHTHSLQRFSSLWSVRLLLVALVALWSLNEVVRLPFIRRNYLYPFLSPEQEAAICQLNVVLSLGFLQPCFLMTLLYLLNASIKKRNPNCARAIASLLLLSSPLLCLQVIFVYFTPFAARLPKFMYVSSVVSADLRGDKMVLCACPFFSWLVYGGFSLAYGVAFSVSCWRVMAFVINKGIAHRVNVLASTVMVALPAQMVCLCLSWVWMPESNVYGAMLLTMFLSVAVCMAVAVLLLVVKPIQEALEAGGEDSLWPAL
ncbi:uncharacterized protein LOC131014749 [Salvia miltiorrhiza]|uniref:uncharacterized protein LOC131014749 n=1 Tax=Salvia miltiorrhiza TaxID=226208 RepID=UPI0025AC96F7|nr:uncharacterized protein LOC131014749 [Salvia miltiorrhiza]